MRFIRRARTGRPLKIPRKSLQNIEKKLYFNIIITCIAASVYPTNRSLEPVRQPGSSRTSLHKSALK